jgi:transcriptional regulator GlxA family with amidase domain
VARLHGVLDVATFCGLPPVLRPGAFRFPKLLVSAQNIVHHWTRKIPGYQLALHTHCVRLLDLLWKEAIAQGVVHEAAGGNHAIQATRLLPVLHEVERRFAAHLTLADLAEVVHLHPVYFATLFKQVFGLAPMHYVARYRLERARDLLLASNLSLHEIAARTGFYDAAHLIRAFRRVEGVPPGRFRHARAS